MSSQNNPDFFQSKVLGHPSGLFVLFFTEMWERFSFYGMRVLLIQYLTASVLGHNPGLGWEIGEATALYGTYVLLLYLTPVFGGIIADKYIGSRNAVIIGALIMTLGHAAMAFESIYMFFLGLTCLIIGTGFFKPNMPSILGEMYKAFPEKKDGAYTIFYMGVNAGAFFGMLLCGYFAEKVGWHFGFGLAGIFMLLGTFQFWLAKPLFGNLGMAKKDEEEESTETISMVENPSVIDTDVKVTTGTNQEKRNPFTKLDIVLAIYVAIIGFAYAINDPLSKNGIYDIFAFLDTSFLRGQSIVVLVTLVVFIFMLVNRIRRYGTVVRDRMFGVMLMAFFLIFFFVGFEQGAHSLVIVARDFVDRTLVGDGLLYFNIVNSLLTVVPLLIISWVLIKLAIVTWDKIKWSNIILFVCFLLIWLVTIVMLKKEFSAEASEITVSWFSTLNAFFIIALASSVSKIWGSKYNPTAAYKYGFGLILVAIGFIVLLIGFNQASAGKISLFWLIGLYLFHTLGELFISPVGLSYVSKLVPARMLAFMFGVWYLAIAIAQKISASLGGIIGKAEEEQQVISFLYIFISITIAAGILVILLNPLIKRLMHGVK